MINTAIDTKTHIEAIQANNNEEELSKFISNPSVLSLMPTVEPAEPSEAMRRPGGKSPDKNADPPAGVMDFATKSSLESR